LRPHLTHLFMEAGDLQRARWFWTDAIGLELLDDHGAYIRVGGGGGFSIGIEQAAPGRVSPPGPEITVRVENVDAVVARLLDLGIEIVEGPSDQPWGARHAWLLDPDGRRMSIYSSPHPIM
jgi:catechol 2,3-dioxygenase-like lactoylglutathione lyase family enzyme